MNRVTAASLSHLSLPDLPRNHSPVSVIMGGICNIALEGFTWRVWKYDADYRFLVTNEPNRLIPLESMKKSIPVRIDDLGLCTSS